MIHNTAYIGPEVVFDGEPDVRHFATVAGYNKIGSGVTIYQYANVGRYTIIDNNVYFGAKAITTNTRRIVHGRKFTELVKPVYICRGARIGTGAIILPGVRIGEECLIGAGAVVTKDTRPYSVYYGNPAKYIRPVPEEEWLVPPSQSCQWLVQDRSLSRPL